jgi:hypothetical protein
LRPAATAGLVAVALDPDYREYQHSSHAFERHAIEAQDWSSRCHIRRKINDGGHITLISVIVGPSRSAARDIPSLKSGRG